jgi:uncharacterized protein YaaN involved in tellurite resistance
MTHFLYQDPKARATVTHMKNKEAEELANLKLQLEAKGKLDHLSNTTNDLLCRTAPRGAKVAALKNAGEYCIRRD